MELETNKVLIKALLAQARELQAQQEDMPVNKWDGIERRRRNYGLPSDRRINERQNA